VEKNQNLDISSIIDGLKELRSFVLLEKLRDILRYKKKIRNSKKDKI